MVRVTEPVQVHLFASADPVGVTQAAWTTPLASARVTVGGNTVRLGANESAAVAVESFWPSQWYELDVDNRADDCWRCDAAPATTAVGLCAACRDGLRERKEE